MERFIKGGHYVVVKPKDWGAFAEMCNAAGLTWGRRRQKVSEYAPKPVGEGKPLRVVVVDGVMLWAPADAPKRFDFPVMGFQNLKPLTKQTDRVVITSEGREITARLIAGKRTIKTTKATCSPDDVNHFGPGALLAMYRALETEADRELAIDLIREDRNKRLGRVYPKACNSVRCKKNTADADQLAATLAEALSNVFGAQVLVIHEGESRPGRTRFLQAAEEAARLAATGAKQ